jgi:hypothetical protein
LRRQIGAHCSPAQALNAEVVPVLYVSYRKFPANKFQDFVLLVPAFEMRVILSCPTCPEGQFACNSSNDRNTTRNSKTAERRQTINSARTLAFEMQMYWRDELLAGFQNFAWHVQITVRWIDESRRSCAQV